MPDLLDRRYELRELLGKGAQGEVYAAWDRELERPVAVKVLSSGDLEDLRSEFETVAAIRHPGLVAVHDLGQAHGRPYYTMDLVQGVAAHEVGWEAGASPVLARFLTQCLAALDFLHGRGLIHRDLKPGNILISGTGIERGADPQGLYRQVCRCPDLRVRIADFGLLHSGAAAPAHVAGTVVYLPPEAFQDRPGPAWDLYCLGITLYELISRSLPPGSASLGRFLRDPQPLPALTSGPAWLSEIVARLTAPYPEQRFASARAALTDLERLCPADPSLGRLQQCELVGRAQELLAIESQLEAAFSRRSGSLIQVVGPRGAGKSRLLREVAVRAQVRGTRTWMRRFQPDAPLAALLLSSDGSVPPVEGPPEQRIREILAFLDRHYRRQIDTPSLLLLDDVDRPDPIFAQVLERLRSVIADLPLMVLITARNAPLRSWTSVELRPLAGQSVAELACGLTGSTDLRPQFLAQLERHGDGTPGRAAGLLGGLARRGVIRRIAGIWNFQLEDLPDRVWSDLPGSEEAMEILGALTPELRRILTEAALLGLRFEERLLAALAGPPVLSKLEDLSLRGLVAADGPGWRFVSEDLRRICLEAIPEAERPSAHDRAAEVLEPGSVAFWQHRAEGTDSGRAVEALRALARHFQKLGLAAEAIDCLQRALDRSRGATASAVRFELAEALLDLGESARAAQLLQAGLETDPQSRLLYCKALVEQKRNAEAIEILRSLEPACRGRPDLDAERLQHLGNAWLQASEPEPARQCLDTALHLARQTGDRGLQARLLGSLGKLLFGLSRLPEAREAYGSALHLFEELKDRRRRSVCLNGLAVIEWQDGNLRRVVELLQDALQIQDDIGLLDAQLTLRRNLGLAHYQLGHLEQARTLYAQATALAARIDASPAERLGCLNNEALVELRLGAPEQALALLRRALALAQDHGLALEEAVVLGNLGDVQLELGDLGEARSCFEASLRKAAALGARDVRVEGLRRLGDAALAGLDFPEAAERLGLALEEARADGIRLEEAKALLGLGKLCGLTGKLPECREQLQAAIGLFRALEASFELAEALGTLAFVPDASGSAWNPAVLDEALQLYRTMGVRRRAEKLEERRSFAHSRAGRLPNTRAKLETILETTVKLSRSLALEPLLADIVTHAVDFTGAGRAVLFLEDAAGQLHPRIAQGRDGRRLDLQTLRLSHGVLEQVRDSGEAICLTDVASSPGWSERQSIVDLGLESIMCVPLQVEGRLLGVLYVDNQAAPGMTYTPEDLPFLQALGSHAALAIDKAQTHEALMRSYQGLQESRDQLARTLEQLRQAQEGIVRSEKMAALGQLAASIVHDLAQPVTSVMFSGEEAMICLESMDQNANAERLRLRLRTIQDAAEHMSGILKGIQRFSRSSEGPLGPLALSDVLKSVLQFVHHSLSHRRVTVDAVPESLPQVLGDPNQMMQVFTNLLMNACDALEDRPEAQVWIRGGRDPKTGEGLVWVRDNGPGIPPEDRERAFEPFFTTKPSDRGTGLGLAIIRQILEKHGGSIRLLEDDGPGASFELRFPPYSPT